MVLLDQISSHRLVTMKTLQKSLGANTMVLFSVNNTTQLSYLATAAGTRLLVDKVLLRH